MGQLKAKMGPPARPRWQKCLPHPTYQFSPWARQHRKQAPRQHARPLHTDTCPRSLVDTLSHRVLTLSAQPLLCHRTELCQAEPPYSENKLQRRAPAPSGCHGERASVVGGGWLEKEPSGRALESEAPGC